MSGKRLWITMQKTWILTRTSRIVTICLLLTVVVFASIYLIYRNSPLRAFRQFKIGESQFDVKARLGEPDLSKNYEKCCIWYYGNDENGRSDLIINNNTNGFPETYNAFQLVFDRHRRLIAYSWIGESKFVQTQDGAYAGDVAVRNETVVMQCKCVQRW